MKRIMTVALVCATFVASAAAAEQNDVVMFRGGTILTVANGVIRDGYILVRDGKIAAIGSNAVVPTGVRMVDLSGAYIMPGIIDGHSHIALDGDINEMTAPVTAQVNMMDAIIPDDHHIYLALAGGVTSAKLMHGSANVIGGVCVNVKFKFGKPLREMVIPGARPLIKMALGENPKRVYGDRDQEPSTRPGIFAVMRQALLDAQDYQRSWDAYQKKVDAGAEATPPKRDLKLETLAKVLAGEIGIDCHNYSAHEILTLLNIAKEFNLPLVTLSHALEAYKIRDRLAEAGVSVQTHSDWWGYKWEAYDAIPYNIGMLLDAGVNATIISDGGDVMRRMNREAAKIVKYSGISEDAALALITINAARAMGIDDRTGSIEVGKDADFAVFDHDPLDSRAKCIMTVIEGEIYFDINTARRAAIQ